MGTGDLHIFVGWLAMLLGVVAGAAIGLFFHREDWAGGYGSFRRRMLRLGHVSFFGLGFINLMYGLTLQVIQFQPTSLTVTSVGFLLGAVLMPTVCFLSAWRKSFRHLFPLPVLSVLTGIAFLLIGWSPA